MEQAELHKVLSRYTLPSTGRSLVQTGIALGIYLASITSITSPPYSQLQTQRGFDEVPALQEIDPIPYLSGLRNLCLSLWDEQSSLLVSFAEAKVIIENSELQSRDQKL